VFPFKLPPRYEFDGPRLQGGQGYVYVCTDNYLERKVAIKVMKSVHDTSALQKELASIQAVRSRHIAQVYDLVFAKNSGMIGLVQEYVPGPDLEEYANLKKDFLALVYQVACGLADIHRSSRIHRDIKPSNIRLDGEKIAKILDFGLATVAKPDAETVHSRGTQYYIAPELYQSPPVKYTAVVDTFAFGVTARVVADGGKLPLGLKQTPPYATPLPSFSSCIIGLPQEVVALLDRCLAVKPQDRPKMDEIRDALAKRLVFGQHRGMITDQGKTHELSSVGQTVTLRVQNDTMTIKYDGLDFIVDAVSGDVFINNHAAQQGTSLPASCVITLGGPQLGQARTFVPFNVSHPAVVL
jgi:eukaryotic-like serine/threonine-protein kinase